MMAKSFSIASDESDKDQTQTGVEGYAWFLERLKEESCKELVSKLRAFCARFSPEMNREDASLRFQIFLEKAHSKILTAPPFEKLTSPAQKERVMDCLEKFLVKHLGPKVYDANPDDSVSDKLLFEKMQAMQTGGLSLKKHLRGPSLPTELTDLAVKELQSLQSYRAPKDKLQCILNAQKVIRHALDIKAAGEWSADDLLPVIIHCVVRARPQRLQSDASLIRWFSAPGRLEGENDYIFTQLELAIAFIRDFDLRLLRPVTAELRESLDGITGNYDTLSLTLSDLPGFVRECQDMHEFLEILCPGRATGYDGAVSLAKFPVVLEWYASQADFFRKLKATIEI